MKRIFNSNCQLQQKYHLPKHRLDNIACYKLSLHAKMRAAQRGLTLQDIDYVLRYGHLYRVYKTEIYFLRAVDIPDEDRQSMKRLEGTAIIIVQRDRCIATVWRNRKHGSRNIHHKLARTYS